jgi:hypothetical protein
VIPPGSTVTASVRLTCEIIVGLSNFCVPLSSILAEKPSPFPVCLVRGCDTLCSMRPYVLLICITCALAQTKAPRALASKSAPMNSTAAEGFAVAPMVLKDEGCARDYSRAFGFEGVEIRKRLTDLVTYGCLDTSARGIFKAISLERKDLAVKEGTVAYYRRVLLTYDPERTKTATGGIVVVSPPDKRVYTGWVPEAVFYGVSEERFDKMLAAGEIPLNLK